MADTKLSLKLLVDTKSNKVLFAEAGKDFVDFLFNLLALPLGTVIRLLTKESMAGCIGNLYESVKNLSETYMQPNQSKDLLLEPKSPPLTGTTLLLKSTGEPSTRKFYMCPNGCRNVADDASATCPRCAYNMNAELNYIAPQAAKGCSSNEEGYVKGVVTYMVMDDLVVQPMSTISSITLLNKFHVKEVGALREKVVDFSVAEGLKLLQESLQSKTVLTTVFLGNTGV